MSRILIELSNGSILGKKGCLNNKNTFILYLIRNGNTEYINANTSHDIPSDNSS